MVSFLPRRVALVKEAADRGYGVAPAFLEDLYYVPLGQDHNRVAIFADLLVGLRVDVRGRDQDTELRYLSREMRRLVQRTPTLFKGS